MHLATISLILLTVQLFSQIGVLEAFTVPCNVSVLTVRRVEMCPTNTIALEEAAKKKNCSKLALEGQACESFIYHCVLNDDLKYAIEVCAPSIFIVGNVCAMFSTARMGIVRIDGNVCEKCPFGYNSTEASFYTECYTKLSEHFTEEIHQRSEGITTPDGNNEIRNTYSQDESTVLTPILVTIIAVLVIVIIFITIIMIYFRRQKNKRDITNQTGTPLLPASNNEYKLYRTNNIEANISFAKLSNYLAVNFPPEKLQHLKKLVLDTKQVENVKSFIEADTAMKCFTILQDEYLFTRKDVILMQFLCKETQCEDLYKKCIKHALAHNALCFIENPPDKGFKKVQIHIQDDYENYAGNRKQIQKVVKIVAAMLDCEQEDILVNDVRPSGSVILVFSIKKKYARKLLALNAEDGQKLRMLKIDYLIVDEKTIILETSKELFERELFQIIYKLSNAYRIHQCFKCPGDTEFVCKTCKSDLCLRCKENHAKDQKTLDHNVVRYFEKFNYIPRQEICVRHPKTVYEEYCESCNVPLCFYCSWDHSNKFIRFVFGRKQHRVTDMREAWKAKRQKHRGIIHTIRSEALFYRPVLLARVRDNFKTSHTKFSLFQLDMIKKANNLKDLIDYVNKHFVYKVSCDFDLKHRSLKQKIIMNRHLFRLQKYVHIYEQSAISPLKFLSSIKRARLPQTHLTLHTSQLSMTESFNKKDVIMYLSGINIIQRENKRVGSECLLKLMQSPVLVHSVKLTSVSGCDHISCVTSNWVWVNRWNNLILTNTEDVTLNRLEDSSRELSIGSHTVNNEGKLIYIDLNNTIKKLSNDMKTTTTFIKKTHYPWKPMCVYCSQSTGDLLVGMLREDTKTGKVSRYNQSGQRTQTIHPNSKGLQQNSIPHYITENNNGDVVVSDLRAVEVIDFRGRHRFSYTGPSGSGLRPFAVCTDALSHILVCDDLTSTVQMISKDGHFLMYLVQRSFWLSKPHSLSYDNTTHRLWVGSMLENKVCVYRYIQQDHIEDLYHTSEYKEESLKKIRMTNIKQLQANTEQLQKMMPRPVLLQSLILTDVDGCDHISCVTSDLVWLKRWNKLILKNTTGETLHRVEDLRTDLNTGSHTVNNEGNLIYIDKNFTINKLSKDMKTTTTFIERAYLPWKPRCVYWSAATGDLLVGMYSAYTNTWKVARFNHCGKINQTKLQYVRVGFQEYGRPNYISENSNGDVVVSVLSTHIKLSGVVVTEREGRHRFTYTGHPLGSGLRPFGICTDALSHILVCDGITNTVQMINKDGMFLSYLIKNHLDIYTPHCLSYDVNTHRLWVGSNYDSVVCVYRYIQQNSMEDVYHVINNAEESLNKIPMTKVEEPQTKAMELLKVVPFSEMIQNVKVSDVYGCNHISFVTSDQVWISHIMNLLLTNTKGDTLHFVMDLCRDVDGGHTVNDKSELVYIDKNYNIKKLSKDMKTTTTFVERTYHKWRPRCVYSSPATGDLLIGMHRKDTKIGKIVRFNRSGQQTQTIQCNKTGLNLYSGPRYVTENTNGDVVASDNTAVVVTKRVGTYRFSYTGPFESGLQSLGICTDALSHILVCDGITSTVQMISKDGQFLSYLPKNPLGIRTPHSLSYDLNTHHLWVGSLEDNQVCVYSYTQRQHRVDITNYAMGSLSEIQKTKKENLSERIARIFERMS